MKNLENFDLIRVFDTSALDRNIKKNKIKNYFCQDIIEALNAKKILNDDSYIYTFAGVQNGQAKTFIDNQIIPICVNLSQLDYFNKEAGHKKQKPKVAIHFDTGMNRTGLSFEEVKELSQNWEKYTSNLDVILYVSHLHSSYNKKDVANKIQIERFKKFTSMLPKCKCSLSATGGSFRLCPDFHFDMVRVGYGIYGMLREMESIISVYAKILQIRNVKKGEKIGYFGGWKATKDMKIAVLNIGYKDGYSRSLSKSNKLFDRIRARLHSGAGFAKSYMLIDKYKCPVVGIISMNNTMIDVSNVPEKILATHNWVEVIGNKSIAFGFGVVSEQIKSHGI